MNNPIIECPSCSARNRVPVAAKGHPRCAKCKADLPWLVEAGDAEFDAAIDTKVPVLVDLWAPWCGPCRMVAPGVEAVARKHAGRLKAVKVNVDQNPRVSARFGVQSIPALYLLEGGEVVDSQIGAVGPDALDDWVRPHLGSGGR